MPNIAYMSVLLAALLVWLIGVPVFFWLLAAIYPARLRHLVRKSTQFDHGSSLMAPVTRLAARRGAAPLAGRQKLS